MCHPAVYISYEDNGVEMSREFMGGNRDQLFLLPPSVDGWVPQHHVVRFIWDCVGQIDMFFSTMRMVRKAGPHTILR